MNNRVFNFVLLQVILLLLNLLFFIWVGTDCSRVTWFSYGCAMVAYAILELDVLVLRHKSTPARGSFTTYLALALFLAEVVIGIVLSLITDNLVVAVSVQLVLLLIFATFGGLFMSSNRKLESTFNKQQEEAEYIRDVSRRLKSIEIQVTDAAARKEVRKLNDIVRCSPVKTNNVARGYEVKVMQGVDAMATAAGAQDWATVAEIARNLAVDAASRNNVL